MMTTGEGDMADMATLFAAVAVFYAADPIRVEVLRGDGELSGTVAWSRELGGWAIAVKAAHAGRSVDQVYESMFHELAHALHGDVLRGADGLALGHTEHVERIVSGERKVWQEKVGADLAQEQRAALWAKCEYPKWAGVLSTGNVANIKALVNELQRIGATNKGLIELEVFK